MLKHIIHFFSLIFCCSYAAPVLCYNLKINDAFITIQLNNAPAVRTTFLPLFKEFENETGIKVIPLRYIQDDEFKQYVTQGYNGNLPLPDVLNGLSSEKFLSIVKKGMVHPINHLWEKNQWTNSFPQPIVSWITYQDDRYALPYVKYSWGLFFQKSLVKKFGPIPTEWNLFISYCETIKNSGMDVFPASNKQNWIASAWFEYITLRTYGYSFLEQILLGNISYHDYRIQNVLTLWKGMIDKGLFSHHYKGYQWEEYLPQFLRNKFAFIFMSSSLARRIYDPIMLEEIEYIPFPKISDIPADEVSPTSIFFISSKSRKIEYAEKFLEFFARPTIQTRIALHLFSSPAISTAEIPDNKIIQLGAEILKNASQLSPFYDRVIREEFSKQVLPFFSDFIFSGDINQLTNALEKNRIKYYTKLIN